MEDQHRSHHRRKGEPEQSKVESAPSLCSYGKPHSIRNYNLISVGTPSETIASGSARISVKSGARACSSRIAARAIDSTPVAEHRHRPDRASDRGAARESRGCPGRCRQGSGYVQGLVPGRQSAHAYGAACNGPQAARHSVGRHSFFRFSCGSPEESIMPTPAIKTDSPFWQLPVAALLGQVAASPGGSGLVVHSKIAWHRRRLSPAEPLAA
jgi:hypothetical protein